MAPDSALVDDAVGRDLPRFASWLDAATLATLLLAETIAGVVLPKTWSIGGVSPLYGVAVLLAALRHGLFPTPTILGRARQALARCWHDDATRRTWVLALTTRLAVLLAGYLAVTWIGYTFNPLVHVRISHNALWNLPARWDAAWYLRLARTGYHWSAEDAAGNVQQDVAFFPAFPISMRIAGDVVTVPARVLRDPDLFGNGNTRVVWGGVIVSVLAFCAALTRLRRHVLQATGDGDTASRAVLLMATYPFALFYSAPYSEGLFLLAAVVTVAAWRRHDLRTASLGGLLAGLSRSNGWALSVALLVGALIESRRSRSLKPTYWLTALTPALGTAAFSVYVYRLTGDPVAWARAQQAWGRKTDIFGFVTRRIDRLADGVAAYVRSDPLDVLTVIAVVGFLALCVVLVRRRDWIGATLVAVYLLPAILIDLPAIGRMTSVLFPAFVALASVLSRRQTDVVAGLFAAGQLILAARFFTWYPPY